jgi:hypothetical protein
MTFAQVGLLANLDARSVLAPRGNLPGASRRAINKSSAIGALFLRFVRQQLVHDLAQKHR